MNWTAKQGNNTTLGLLVSKASLKNEIHRHTKWRATEKPINKKERENKTKPHMCFIILLGFFAISLKREEFKLESKLCLWGSQSRTTNWNKWKSICRPLRPHVALCTHEHCYGISNTSEKIHLCENIIQDKFWCVLELSTPWWLLVIRVHCGLPHLNTPEAVSNAEERTVKFHSLWEASALCWQAHFSTSPCNLNVFVLCSGGHAKASWFSVLL